MVDRAIGSNPNSWIVWEQRDDVFGSTGNFQEAIRSFERAVRLSPPDAIVFATGGAAQVRLMAGFGDLRQAEMV
jgi:adenylate cyclase